MKRSYNSYLSFSILLIIISLLIGLESCKTKLCCLQFNADTDEATYCNNHRAAVGLYVREAAPDTTQMVNRLMEFENFYNSIRECQNVSCIEENIRNTTNLQGFLERYQLEHTFAERDTNVSPEDKATLILCGFKHAIEELRLNLKL